jgi:hypothetical protein
MQQKEGIKKMGNTNFKSGGGAKKIKVLSRMIQ